MMNFDFASTKLPHVTSFERTFPHFYIYSISTLILYLTKIFSRIFALYTDKPLLTRKQTPKFSREFYT